MTSTSSSALPAPRGELRFADPITHGMETILESLPKVSSGYTPHRMLQSLKPEERRAAVEVGLKAMNSPALHSVIKRKKAGGFPLHRLIIRNKDDCLRISLVARTVLGKGSLKVVKELETIEFDKKSFTVTLRDEAIAKVKVRFIRTDESTGEIFFSDKMELKAHLAVEKEKTLYDEFRDCPFVQKLQRFMTRIHDAKHIRKTYLQHKRATLGSLRDFVKSATPADRLLLADTLFLAFFQSTKALQAFHAKGYYYLDYKAENILGLDPGHWVMSDLESLFTKEEYLARPRSIPTTEFTAPPEYAHLNIHKLDPEKHEAWSLGMSILRAFGSNGVFVSLGLRIEDNELCREDVKRLTQENLDRVILAVTSTYPPHHRVPMQAILLRLLRIEPSERISIDEASAMLEAIVCSKVSKAST